MAHNKFDHEKSPITQVLFSLNLLSEKFENLTGLTSQNFLTGY
jgi:hypothetical protein